MACRSLRALAAAALAASEVSLVVAEGSPVVDHDTNYVAGITYSQIADVSSADACNQICAKQPVLLCKSWVWGKQYPHDTENSMCFLKSEAPTASSKVPAPGIVSGVPAATTHKPWDAWAAVSTAAPTTAAPTTDAPTTAAQTTDAPTTAAPTTAAPTTAAPTTAAPTTEAPTTAAPTTAAPTTAAPTTAAPTTAAPTTEAPTTAAPTTAAPTTEAPTTAAPTTAAPTTAAPTTEAPSSSDDAAEDEKSEPAKRKKKQHYGNIKENDQCGGKSWTGSGYCSVGLECVFQNDWYSQCRRKSGASLTLTPGRKKGCSDPTLFCFSVVTPGTSEPGLMMQQWNLRAGLFTCDAHSIISNVSAWALFPDKNMASKVKVSIINAQLWGSVAYGPHGHPHVLNTPVFVKAWQKILDDGVYKNYDWTLKLDVDAVIAAPRVKALLLSKPCDGDRFAPQYILNVGADAVGNFLHGPVECLSQAAVDAYGRGAARCQREVDSSLEGEDWYLNACLKLLNVPGVQDLMLLQDAYAWGKKQVECTTQHGVFHPCKDNWRFSHCIQQIGPDAVVPAQAYWTTDRQAFVMKYGTRGAAAASRGGAGEWRGMTGMSLAALFFSVALSVAFAAKALQHRSALWQRAMVALRVRHGPSYSSVRHCQREGASASYLIE